MEWTERPDLAEQVNQFMAEKGYGNRVKNIRHRGETVQWCIEASTGDDWWFPIEKGCSVMEEYIRKLIQLGEFNEIPPV